MIPRTSIEDRIHIVARKHGLSLAWLKAEGRPCREEMQNYRDCIRELHIGHAMPKYQIAKILGKDPATIFSALAN